MAHQIQVHLRHIHVLGIPNLVKSVECIKLKGIVLTLRQIMRSIEISSQYFTPTDSFYTRVKVEVLELLALSAYLVEDSIEVSG